jgi:hypothetical protein
MTKMDETTDQLEERIEKAVADYKATGEVASSFQRLPAYRYIRKSDHLPKEVPYGLLGCEIVCKVKIFGGPVDKWICSYNPETDIAYGVTDLGYGKEVGDFYMHEVVDVRIPPFGLPLEREQGYEPQSLREVMGWTFEEGDPSEEVRDQAAEVARDRYLATETAQLRKIEAKREARAEERRQLRSDEQRPLEDDTSRREEDARTTAGQGRET